ncbi:MAG: nucleotide pyrophosphohydrolase [Streptosporangiaceae bacterium]
MTIENLQRRLREFVTERDWEQFQTPKNLVMALTGEVGELNEIFQWLTPEQAAAVMSEPAQASDVRDEIADVLAYLLRLADVLDVDVAAALTAKIGKNAVKYPVEAASGLAAKYTTLGGHGQAASGGSGPGG